jgi:hypothetical protein
MPNAPIQNKERLETLLFLTIAHAEKTRLSNAYENDRPNQIVPAPSSIKAAFRLLSSALTEEDYRALKKHAAEFEKLSDEEKSVLQSRALNRITARSSFLDKDVHFTQIVEVLRREPEYLQKFILRHLPPEMSIEVAPSLEIETFQTESAPENISQNLQHLVRRKFLANFVARESLYEQKPLTFLTGENLLRLLQTLGQHEIALVCRGIAEIENLAPFLRRFGDFDAQFIVQEMANLGATEPRRIEQAEDLVKEAWQSEPSPALVTQFIGTLKLAAALAALSDAMQIRYTTQKLPFNIAAKLENRLQFLNEKIGEQDVESLELIGLYEAEVETTAARILLEQVQPRNSAATRQKRGAK